MREALYYKIEAEGELVCQLCPHRCQVAPEKTGRCRVRRRQGNRLVLPYYGQISALALDPIEKKPLYHYYPGAQILSVGFWGCNFHCPFCQNYTISQRLGTEHDYLAASDLVQLAKTKKSFALAYTYSEPLIHFEYLMDCAKFAQQAGLKNVLVSNGFICREPALAILPYLDAANIDLKTFNPEFYRQEIGGDLEAVKEFIRLAWGRIQLEVTTLVIPTKNDSPEEIEAIARFLAELSPYLPWHLSCYYPTYKYTIPSTPPSKVSALAEIARRYLAYVYEGNVGLKETNTSCPSCKNLLIRRRGYEVALAGLHGARCTKCGFDTQIPGL